MRTRSEDRRLLEAADDEARRFLERVARYLAAEDGGVPGTNPRESGAVRRASLDLTRALAEWRRR